MPINIPASLTASSLLLVFIFNIVSLATVGWYTISDGGVDAYYGLTETEICGSGCVSRKYGDIVDDTQGSDKKDWTQLQAGGALATLFLVLNVLLTVLLLFVLFVVFIEPLSNAIPQISKNPLLSSKVFFFPLAVIPLQIVALIFWVALFPFYKDYQDAKLDISIGAGIALIIVSVIVPAVVFVVCTKVLKASTPSPK